jgi:signal transduction histidine kinase
VVQVCARAGSSPSQRAGAPCRPPEIVIEVADQGPGIPEGEAERVFERFYRADAARASNQGGAGLGLAIARWIVDLHGGRIRAERNQPHGCRMVVVLPEAPHDPVR